jgi:hypothetical protein
MSALLRVSLMFVVKSSLLNKGHVLINALKALVSIVSICSTQVVFLSNITPRYFAICTNGMYCPFIVRSDSGGLILWEK